MRTAFTRIFLRFLQYLRGSLEIGLEVPPYQFVVIASSILFLWALINCLPLRFGAKYVKELIFNGEIPFLDTNKCPDELNVLLAVQKTGLAKLNFLQVFLHQSKGT